MIQVRGLRKTFGEVVAVDDLSLHVEEAEIFGILGANGSGKTTTVECVAGLRRPDSGEVRVGGLDPVRDRAAVTRVVGVQLQQSALPAKQSVREALSLYASFYDDPVDGIALAESLGLGAKLNTRYANLSGGQQQRVAVALALVGRPRVALLDELSTGLDPRSRRELWGVVEAAREAGTTIVLVTHFMEEARHLCDRVAVMDRGRITALDTPEGVVRSIGAPTIMSFAAEDPVDERPLMDIPGVADIRRREDGTTELSLADEAVLPVLGALAAGGVQPQRLRIVDSTLDDAFLDLTSDEGEQ